MKALEDETVFKSKLDNYDCTLQLQSEHLKLLIIDESTLIKYSAAINQQFINKNKNLQFFFNTISQLYHYLTSCFSQLTITKTGALLFNLEMNFGGKIRKYVCQIQTTKQDIPESQAHSIKTKKMQKQVETLQQQISKLRKDFEEQEKRQKGMLVRLSQYERIINGKDQILNTIFYQLKELKEWRQQVQKREEFIVTQKNKFVSDEANPHFKKFVQIGNKYKKIAGGFWDILINKIPFDKNEISKYHIRQIKAGNNGSFMYGVGSELIKGLNRAQDSKQFIGYYENTGNIYEQGQSKKGGPKIKDGQLITIIVDPKKWKIFWYINGKKQAEASIGAQLRTKNLFLALIVFNDESQLQFFG